MIKQLNNELAERDLKDLYYLDELIKDMYKSVGLEGDKYIVFLHDWYEELFKKVNHTNKQREKYLRQMFGDEFYEDDNFLTISERKDFLNYKL